MKVSLEVPGKLRPLYHSKVRYKGVSGGRGSAKSWGAIDYILSKITKNPNLNTVCLREVQKSIKFSSKKLLEDRITTLNLNAHFEILTNEIRLKQGKGIVIFQGLQDHTVDSIKSLEGFDIAFVEEAQSISHHSLDLLTPTIRKDNAELIFAWNPRYPTDAVEELFETKSNSIRIHINYTNNPFCPKSIIEEAEELKELNLSKYNHIYLGAFSSGDDLAIIKEDWIKSSIEAYKRLHKEVVGVKRAGYDVADGKDEKGEEVKNDTNAIAVMHGNCLTHIEEWKAGKDEIVESTKRVNLTAKDFKVNVVNYDNIGVGAGVGSIFKTLSPSFEYKAFTASNSPQNPDDNYKLNKTNKDMFKNLKAQAWQTVADKFINTHNYITKGIECDFSEMILIKDDLKLLDKLVIELSSPREETDGSGRMLVESKSTLKKRGVASPNLADAFIMSSFKIDTNVVKAATATIKGL